MAYDHAQSFRITQRNGDQTTGIRVIESLSELPEVAYLGQFIYMRAEDRFRVYDGDGWQDMRTGLQTYVQEDEPTEGMVAGDSWLDPLTKVVKYYDGTAWVLPLVEGDQIDPDYAATIRITADQIESDTTLTAKLNVTGELKVLGYNEDGTPNGASITLSGTGGPTGGFTVVGQPDPAKGEVVGPTNVFFPVNGAPNIISGTLQAETLTVNGDVNGKSATFAQTSALQNDAKLILNDTVAAPFAQPTAQTYYETKTVDLNTPPEGGSSWYKIENGVIHGTYLYWIGQTNNGYWYLNRTPLNGTTTGQVSAPITTGKNNWNSSLERPYDLCLSADGAQIIVACEWTASDTTHPLYWRTFPITNFGTGIGSTSQGSGFTFSFQKQNGTDVQGDTVLYKPFIGLTHNGTGYVIAYKDASGFIAMKQFDTMGSAPSATYGSNYGWTINHIRGFHYNANTAGQPTTGDHGDDLGRYYIANSPMTAAATTQRVHVLEISGSTLIERDVEDTFPLVDSYQRSIMWDGSNFYTYGVVTTNHTNLVLQKYTNVNTADQTDTWWVGYSFSDGTSETTISPRASFTMNRRAGWKVTVASSPVGGVRIYVGTGETDPVTETNPYQNMWRQDPALANGATTAIYDTISWNTGNPVPGPGSGTAFGTGTPALIQSQASDSDTGTTLPSILLQGDGYARIREIYSSKLLLTSTQDVTGEADNKPPLRIGNINGSHLRMDGNEIQAMKSNTLNDWNSLYLNLGGGHVDVGGQLNVRNNGLNLGSDSRTIKRFDFGTSSITLNANGYGYVTHSLGITPDAVALIPASNYDSGNYYLWANGDSTSTRIYMYCRKGDGAIQTGTRTVTFIAISAT